MMLLSNTLDFICASDGLSEKLAFGAMTAFSGDGACGRIDFKTLAGYLMGSCRTKRMHLQIVGRGVMLLEDESWEQ